MLRNIHRQSIASSVLYVSIGHFCCCQRCFFRLQLIQITSPPLLLSMRQADKQQPNKPVAVDPPQITLLAGGRTQTHAHSCLAKRNFLHLAPFATSLAGINLQPHKHANHLHTHTNIRPLFNQNKVELKQPNSPTSERSARKFPLPPWNSRASLYEALVD